MNIGIVGVGIVGGACKFGFEKLGHCVKVHDIKLDTAIEDVLDTEIVFICVPTPSDPSGSCDISIVRSVVCLLAEKEYDGIIAIKSTVVPGTTEALIKETNKEICFVPEFLRERCSITDFTENHDVCIVGTPSTAVFEKVKKAHGKFPDKFIHLTSSEAEFTKYFNNVFNATLIVFANSFYEVCKNNNVNYTNIKNAIVNRKHISDNYLDCNENFCGFGGMCLPKDTMALANLCKDINVDFFENLLKENSKYKITVYDGMRLGQGGSE